MNGECERERPAAWGCSVRGPLHVRLRIPNQDAWLARKYVWGRVLAVADGLGSKPHSDVGSRAVCRAVARAARECVAGGREYMRSNITGLIHRHWLEGLCGYTPGECAATCLFAVLHGGVLTLGRLGDGMVVATGRNGNADTLLMEDKAGAFSNMTHCLHGGECPRGWELLQLPAESCAHVLLSTDGVADDLAPGTHTAFARGLLEAYGNMPRAAAYRDLRSALIHWPRPGHTDDKTIAIMGLHSTT